MWGSEVKKRRAIILAVAGVAAFAVPCMASAHSIWFAQRARQLALIYGVGADDLDAVRRLPMVKAVAGYDSDWQPVPTKVRVAGPIPVIDSDAPITAVTAVMDYGIWSKTPEGAWENKGRDEVPNAVLSERNMKYAVHVVGTLQPERPQPQMPAFQGQTLQVIPVGPIPLDKDKPLKLRVVFNGQPAAGAEIISDFVNDPDGKRSKTAADGTATVNVRNQGLNVITAIHYGPTDNPTKYTRMEHRATLSFVLPHLPE